MANIFDATLAFLSGNSYSKGEIDTSTHEMKILFQEKLPYQTGSTITGQTYVWNEEFITLVIIAMSSDSLNQMSADEKKLWYSFVQFEDLQSSSADDTLIYEGGLSAIGCTIPDEFGVSYAILEDLSVSAIECVAPTAVIINEFLLKALDKELMRRLNCEPLDNISFTEADLIEVSTCSI